MPDQTPFIATATKAPSCTLCGIEGPKNFLLPNNTKYGEKESPCKHDVGVCNCCWLEYLTIEVTKAQAISQTEQKTNLTEIKCIECEKVLRKVDIFMRGGSDVFDVYVRTMGFRRSPIHVLTLTASI